MSVAHWRRNRMAFLIAGTLVVGVVLRTAWPDDIHYLGDEAWTFRRVEEARRGEGWASLGMPSSQGVKNAPMSVWVFIALGLVTRASTPPELTRAVALLALVAHAAILLVPFWALRDDAHRRAWVWATLLSITNPVLVFLERKIWAQSVLPIFMVALLLGFMRRETRVGAFAWGLVGALIGQIHMAGFFFAPALVAWTKLFGARADSAGRPRWGAWLLGSVLGIAPAFGWLTYLADAKRYPASTPWWHRLRFEFHQYFLSDPAALSSEYVVGRDDLRHALRWPIVSGHATWLVLFGHAVLLSCAVVLCKRAIDGLRENRQNLRALLRGDGSDTTLLCAATVVGMGSLMVLTGLPVYRHYMLATFPVQYILAAHVMLRKPRGERWLTAMLGASAIVSVGLLTFVHDTGRNAEMGKTYATQQREGVAPEDAR